MTELWTERTLTILATSVIHSSMLKLETAQPITVNGTALATSIKGEGASLVFVHGGVSDLRTWSNQFDTFAESFRTIAYSRRYSRPNEPIPIDSSDPIQKHVDDLASLIDVLEARPAHIVGHSWGALIALLATKQKPEICRSLVLIEPPAVSMHVSVPPKASQIIGLLLTAPRLALAIAKLGGTALGPAEKAFRRGDDKQAIELFGRGVLGKRYFEELSEERYTQVWENRGPDRALALHHGFPDLIGEKWSEVSVPVMLINGAESPRIFDLLNNSLLDRLPDARKRVIPNASHIVQEDAPETLNATILEFLDVAK